MNIITLNRVLLNNTPLNYRRKRILTEKDFYFKTIERTFTFSKSAGGKSIKDGRAYIKRIKGNSVVWNQLLPNSTIPVTSNTTRALNEGTRIVVGHKYLLLADFGGGTSYASVSLFAMVSGESKGIIGLSINENKTYKFFTAEMGGVSNGTGSAEEGNIWQYFYFEGTTESITNTRLIDLTQLFQAGNEPTTIEEFYQRIPSGIDLNAYNEGEVIHCNTESIKSVGDNAWDEEWEVGYLTSTGANAGYVQNYIRAKNYIPVISGVEYYAHVPSNVSDAQLYLCDANYNLIEHKSGWINKTFIVPEGAKYIRFYMNYGGEVYNNDIMLTLVHSGWKQDTDAGYQPYWQDTLPLPIIRKYFPDGMKLAGAAHDEIRHNKASGKWEAVQRIGEVDLGTLDWTLTSQQYFRALLPSDSIAPTNTDYNGFVCAKYERVDFNLIYGQNVAFPCFGIPANNPVCCVFDSSYTDASTFKAAMQGVILYYEAAEWEWVELDAEDQNFRDYYQVADFGTEQSQSSVPSASLLADVGYYFKKSEVKELTLN